MFGEQRKAKQQTQKIGEDDPLMAEVADQTGQAWPRLETGHYELVQRHHNEAANRNVEGVLLEQCDAKQHARKQNEIDGYRPERDDAGRPACGCRRVRCERR